MKYCQQSHLIHNEKKLNFPSIQVESDNQISCGDNHRSLILISGFNALKNNIIFQYKS